MNSLSAPLMVANAFKDILALGLESGYQFKELQSALEKKSSAPAQAPAQAKKAEAKVEEPEEEEEDVDIGGMFD